MEKYSILEASDDFVKLSNEITKFKFALCADRGIDITSQDIGLVALDSIQQYLLSITAYLRSFMKLKQMVTNEEFIGILGLGVSEEQLEGNGAGLIYNFPIRSLVVMVHFIIDSYLNERFVKIKYYKNVNKAFPPHYSNLVDKFRNDLLCLGAFRNSFHNNGIHKSDNIIFNYEVMKISFIKDEVISYNWKTAFLLISESVKALKFIIKNESKSSI